MAFGVTADNGLDVFNEEYGLYLRMGDMNEMPDASLLVDPPDQSPSRKPVAAPLAMGATSPPFTSS